MCTALFVKYDSRVDSILKYDHAQIMIFSIRDWVHMRPDTFSGVLCGYQVPYIYFKKVLDGRKSIISGLDG